jgi:hypothetical protein
MLISMRNTYAFKVQIQQEVGVSSEDKSKVAGCSATRAA